MLASSIATATATVILSLPCKDNIQMLYLYRSTKQRPQGDFFLLHVVGHVYFVIYLIVRIVGILTAGTKLCLTAGIFGYRVKLSIIICHTFLGIPYPNCFFKSSHRPCQNTVRLFRHHLSAKTKAVVILSPSQFFL